MNNLKKFKSLLLILFLVSCQKNNIEKTIATYTIPFNELNDSTFETIANKINNSEIVILGEAGHGDGKTYEVKAELVKYLMKEKGFNTLAIEGEDFINLELKNNLRGEINPSIDLNKWIPSWGHAEQTHVLIKEILNSNNFDWKYIGLEGHIHKEILVKELSKISNVSEDIQEFEKLLDKINNSPSKDITIEEIDFVLDKIDLIKNTVTDTSSDGFLKKSISSIYEGVRSIKYHSVLQGDQNRNIFVNNRDKYMASNVSWYKKNNPNAKIIVWIANFHGAKEIQKIRYKEHDQDLYLNFKLFNEYLIEEFDDKVYSIAFTSSEGEVRDLIDGSESFFIELQKNSLEYYLHQKNIPFGFLDFNEIKHQNPKFSQSKFNSMILGYDNKPGQWLDVFDGIFYIKKNEPLKMSEFQIR